MVWMIALLVLIAGPTEAATKQPASFGPSFSVRELLKKENSDVHNTIAQGKFALAVEKCHSYLRKSMVSPAQKAHLRFLHLYAFAALVSQKKKTHKQMQALLDGYRRKPLVTNFLQIGKNRRPPFNFIDVDEVKQNKTSISLTNDGLSLPLLVRVDLKKTYDLEPRLGKYAFVGGLFEDYLISKKGTSSWIADLRLSAGFLMIMEEELNKKP